MTYQKQAWQNRIVDPVTGAVIQEGTRFTETRMNHIEEGIFAAHTFSESIVGEVNTGFVSTSGGSMGLAFTASGLTASWTAGIAFVKGVRIEVSVGSIHLHQTQGQYLYLDTDGVVKITTSSTVADANCPLWYFATDASKVLTSSDRRRSIGIAKQLDLKAHTDDKSNPHGVTPTKIGAETPAGAQAKVDAHANKATGAHKASAISIEDAAKQFTATNVEGALAELFTSVGDGKALVATAITDKGGTVAGTAPHSFSELAESVSSIRVGDFSIGDTIPVATIFGHPLIFTRLFSCPGTYCFHAVANESFRGTNGTNFYAFSTTQTIWSVAAGSTRFFSTLPSGETYYLNTSGYFYLVSASGVATRLTGGAEAVAGAGDNSAFHCDGTNIYVGSQNGYLWRYVISGTTVEKVWRIRPRTTSVSTIAIDSEGNVYAIFNGNGSEVLSGYFGKFSTSGVTKFLVAQSGFGGVGSVHVDEFDRIYTTFSNMFSRHSSDGSVVWSKQLDNSAAILGFDADGYVYCNHGLYTQKIDPNGSVVWSSEDVNKNPLLKSHTPGAMKNGVVGKTLFIPLDQFLTTSGIVAKAAQEIVLR
ncbi:hypothetical protein CIG75_12710 [Tumebacillus algifaecis]|uniref:Uncharacterized protein n=1 Tax=Tumebacillus algifaecis TaxID=1214604 RepID=A0A223D2E4_9BACL|nr:hypothetical protein [Tumebacillus algifaecis]ASS75760.1 hypothetical protein CIG75_12710 [Tumebacillus algifaecis]